MEISEICWVLAFRYIKKKKKKKEGEVKPKVTAMSFPC